MKACKRDTVSMGGTSDTETRRIRASNFLIINIDYHSKPTMNTYTNKWNK